VQLHS